MSESLPDKCPFCGANYHGEGKTDEWEWVQYKCSTEFENGEWLQDDECRIAQLEATLTARESELAEAQRRVAELESKLAQSTNYVADDELYPHVVWFANGRTVSIASGGHLEIGMGGRLAAAKGDVSDEP